MKEFPMHIYSSRALPRLVSLTTEEARAIAVQTLIEELGHIKISVPVARDNSEEKTVYAMFRVRDLITPTNER